MELSPEQQLALDFQKTFDTDSGKRTLERLSKLCKENKPTYVDHNALGTAYNEGQRSVMLHIRSMLAKSVAEERQKEAIRS